MKVLLTTSIIITIFALSAQAEEISLNPTSSKLKKAAHPEFDPGEMDRPYIRKGHPEFDPGEMDRPYIRKGHPEFDPGEMDRPYIRKSQSSISELSGEAWKPEKPERPENSGSSGAYGPWGDYNKWPQPNVPPSVLMESDNDFIPYSLSLRKSLNQALQFTSKPDIKIQVVVAATAGLTFLQILKRGFFKKGRIALSIIPAPLLAAIIGQQRVIEIQKHSKYSFSDIEEFAMLPASEQKDEWNANEDLAKYIIQVLEQIELKKFATENNIGAGA